MHARALFAIVAVLALTAAPAAAANPAADLVLTNTDLPDRVVTGQRLTYLLTVRNAGPDGANDIELLDVLQSSTILVSVRTSQGSCTGSGTIVCALGNLASGQAASVTIVVDTTRAGTVFNEASVFARAPGDPRHENNRANAITTVGSVPSPQPPTAAGPQAERDADPPGEVRALRATAGNGRVVVRWRSPSEPDFQGVVITRSTADAPDQIVYFGDEEEFTDGGLRNGVLYIYELRSVDRNGNSSEGIWLVARPKGGPLFSPTPNARISSPPMLRWDEVRGATYYNVQLYRGSKKVLSAWPRANRLKLRKRWTFGGRGLHLAPGDYHWFVWPGRGARNRSTYGPVLGRSSFVVVPSGR